MVKDLKLDNELKMLALGVYEGNEKYIPKNWIKIDEYNSKNGFHGKAFIKNGVVVISIRGTEFDDLGDLTNDIKMAFNLLPSQYVTVQNFYEQVKKDFPNKKIIFTGHSLGGSLAQLMGNLTGNETVTFNAYGVGDLIPKEGKNKKNSIRNYGNINDKVFNLNISNQLGETYIISDKKGSEYITNNINGDYIGGLYPKKYHSIEDIGNLEDAVEYKKTENIFSKILKGETSYNVNYKDIDKKRVITNEEIAKMSQEEFERNENFINQQIKSGNVMTKAQAEEKLKLGDLIWVNSYFRSDGTEVSGYYRRRN